MISIRSLSTAMPIINARGAWAQLPSAHEQLDAFVGTARAYALKAAPFLDACDSPEDVKRASLAMIAVLKSAQNAAEVSAGVFVMAESVDLGYAPPLIEYGAATHVCRAVTAHSGGMDLAKTAVSLLCELVTAESYECVSVYYNKVKDRHKSNTEYRIVIAALGEALAALRQELANDAAAVLRADEAARQLIAEEEAERRRKVELQAKRAEAAAHLAAARSEAARAEAAAAYEAAAEKKAAAVSAKAISAASESDAVARAAAAYEAAVRDACAAHCVHTLAEDANRKRPLAEAEGSAAKASRHVCFEMIAAIGIDVADDEELRH